MKKVKLLCCLIVVLLILSGCKGAKQIQGTWHTENGKGTPGLIKLTANKLAIKDQQHNGGWISYQQNAVGTKNGATYYGLTIDHADYSIIFPEKNHNKALFMKVDSTDNYLKGKLIFVMDKQKRPNYQKDAKRYLN